MDNIAYLTLSNGEISNIECNSVYADLLRMMAKCFTDFEGGLVKTGWSFKMVPRSPKGGTIFIVRHNNLSLLACYFVWSPAADDSLWHVVQHVTGSTAPKPKTTPWAAVHEMPHVELVSRDVIATAYDFSRSMALTLADEAESETHRPV